MEFPGNSHTSKMQPSAEEAGAAETPKKVEPVTTGKVTARKKSVGKQMREMFVEEGENLRDWFIKDVFIPTVRGMIVGAFGQMTTGFQQALEEKLTPGERPSITRPPSGGSGPIPYNRYAQNQTVVGRSASATPAYQPRVRRSNDVQEIVFESRQDAINVVLQLEGMIEKYGHTTVGDYYSAINDPTLVPKSTDEEWGWTNLTRARPMPVRGGGYIITFPQPEPIDPGR
ncbi:hypothetical protein SEA_MADAMATO_53 [Streptomyces phage Madamato]|nr:hypothetical protein SEA_MADAMATO_53 [Streptomyces phage Madamato]